MSTKTILKRIAQLAIAALLGSFLTVASIPAASANDGLAAGTIYINTDDDAAIATDSASTGVCEILNGAGTAQTLDNSQRTYQSTESDPYTVTVALGGRVTTGIGSEFFSYTANGVIESDSTNTLHSAYNVFTSRDGTTTDDSIVFTAKAVGTATILSYATTPFSATNTPVAATLADPDGKLTIVVVASCGQGIVDLDESGARVDGMAANAAADISFTYGDTLTFAAGAKAYISAKANNAYGNAIPSTSTWTVDATNGAKVTTSTSSATIQASTTANGTLSSVSATAGGTLYVRVTPATSGVAQTTTVTVKAAGTTLISKTITFLPEASKLVVISKLSGTIGGEGLLVYQLQAADGTVVPGSVSPTVASLDSRVSATTADKAATIYPAASAGASDGVNNTAIVGATTTYGLMGYNCQSGSTSGTSKVTLRHTTPVNEVDIDTVVDLTCAGGLDTYTVSMDKASYKIGEVATVTITAKDSSGAAVSDMTTIGTTAAVTPSGGSMVKEETAGTWAGGGDSFLGGKKSYQVSMTTAGAWTIVVNLPGTTTKSLTAAYTVVDGSGAVTNAEVLAAIVKLIASINKQIANLQKLIRKK